MFLNKFPSVVMLHHVTDDVTLDALKPYSISHASFVRLLDVLVADGYTTIGFEEVQAGKTKGKQIIITFDDCPNHLWDFAIPELQRRNMKAVFYMPTAYLNGKNDWDIVQGKPAVQLMDEADIQRLTTIGMEVGSHSHQHIQLGNCSEQEVTTNLTQSKQILERIIGKKIISIAYPFGSIPQKNKQQLQQAGYSYGLSIYTPNETAYDIRRWIYHDGDDAARIRQKLSLQYRMMRIVKDRLNK